MLVFARRWSGSPSGEISSGTTGEGAAGVGVVFDMVTVGCGARASNKRSAMLVSDRGARLEDRRLECMQRSLALLTAGKAARCAMRS